jgi:Domain of unknown function (DUF4326)
MADPVRIQLSRARGFSLQAYSQSVNGLEAVNVARPSKWGNPYKIGSVVRHPDNGVSVINDAAGAVIMYTGWAEMANAGRATPDAKGHTPTPDEIEVAYKSIRGKNLACWCALDAPCHADVLLRLANAPIKESPND